MDPVRVSQVLVPAASGQGLPAVVLEPEDGDIEELAFVFSQPHSKPGALDDKICGLAEELARSGHRCLVFDTPGERKQGSALSWGAREFEVDDCIRGCEFMKQRLGARLVVLLGTSAGAPLAGSAAAKCSSCDAFVSIGYPFGMLTSMVWGQHYKRILTSRKPRLFIMGANDEFTSVTQLERRVSKAKKSGSARMMVVANVGHQQMKQPSFDPVIASLLLTWLTETDLVDGVDCASGA